MKYLLIEDDLETANYIKQGLEHLGHEVDHAADGNHGLLLGTDSAYSVLVVDRMLPALDGLSIVKALRNASVNTPILLLTAMAGIDDRVAGLNAGGDDYLVKPFAFSELTARLNALTRRRPPHESDTVLQVGDLEMDRLARVVSRAGQRIELQPREFTLLEYLMKNAGRLVTRTMLLESVWDFHFEPRTNIVETHISRLRAKVDRGHDYELIRTIRGSGYMISAPD